MTLKQEIEKISKGKGELYPSDIVEVLGIHYDIVVTALNELEKDGKIAWG